MILRLMGLLMLLSGRRGGGECMVGIGMEMGWRVRGW